MLESYKKGFWEPQGQGAICGFWRAYIRPSDIFDLCHVDVHTL